MRNYKKPLKASAGKLLNFILNSKPFPLPPVDIIHPLAAMLYAISASSPVVANS